ncbi:hypothetical protein C9F11_10210 [Streptomyces sp. YIM 121038]|uniref:hypothetical protein n=1 Tax=Streptomyces sp. YIM 121038 TaxID=2136401 RepID=UPI0011623159|nr:hypothetical protein [Streptomyces sp. YIM 121038]QCX75722.1 hypothetical protein C9F11_10210 [Streptomyces sp. YIM 121038]
MHTYVVLFRDGSQREVEAKGFELEEHGVRFWGRRNSQQPHSFVAFVAYEAMNMFEQRK